MNLGVSIVNVLRRYPAVGVPGIGVFRKVYRPASYDSDKAVFLPPVGRIELVDSDTPAFQLANYLQGQQQLDGSAADAQLASAVQAIMDTISRNGEVVLDGLGRLFVDGTSFIFRPFEIDGFTEKSIAAQMPLVRIPDEPVSLPKEVVDIPAVGREGAVGDGKAGRTGYVPWVLGGVVAAMLIAAVVVWQYRPGWFGIGSEEVTAESDQMVNFPTSSSGTTPLSETDLDSSERDTSLEIVAVDSLRVDSAQEASDQQSQPSVTYEIIVGSFATMAQADKFVTEMKAKGYDLHAINSRMPGNRKKISWGSYATEEEAYKELARVQKTFEPGAWIAKIIHN